MMVAQLNGAVLNGSSISSDAWQGTGKGKRSSGKGGSWGGHQAWAPTFQKKGWGKGGGKQKQHIRDTSKAVWIGGLPDGTKFSQLLELGKTAGDATWAELKGKGTGAICFKTAEGAQEAILVLNGAKLGATSIV